MASGFGVKGGPSRCFTFWQEFRKCYLTSESPSDCALPRDDYLECLHHTKELERTHQIHGRMIQLQHEESKRARDVAKHSNGLSLGLIDVDQDTQEAPQAA
ncbi:NADH dehydrogenase (ubiquinone) Fe-S protein 5 [Malassezia restricta]|uniref:NADH dehydrogenase [ubiquinone] iron-sulfur protein 5 n=1 Tax=Malassezia restricta (strain ATCC 96810 / NBRC 103918 / CBS 7877) TaxID=425264 RepID=A0A3G2S751_MALR7|nr:NADH dehydrogenase (ubiquinone) Fe-S protein 5 [Malassezia restricta]AXA50812.1 NADH dehydrogenase (ubiquinone) Fe-S protein 5 [Malassezia restricta]AYO43690.1 NADH dehydrogenase [ubiquinone] iron-sulfur protein 5-B [Malassezia restricta CBS 7877]